MVVRPSPPSFDGQSELMVLLDQLPTMEHGAIIQQVFDTLGRMMGRDADRLDWKILNNALLDMERGFSSFFPYRHVRKVAVFGSARTAPERPDYRLAQEFSRRVTQLGFMVMTGAGGGIMQAGNEGAGAERSFGLNIQLPFEQGANPVMEGDPKLIDFKYFFTRKLFFIKESDAIVLFPGGFGTQDEAFESLTLIQTGKSDPMPLVLIDHPGGDYWKNWDRYIHENLLARGLISPQDPTLYTLTDSVEQACEVISQFYRVFHSLRHVGQRLVVRLKCPLVDSAIETLNHEFKDILAQGTIEPTAALPAERGDDTVDLPRLVLHFNHRDFARLNQFIRRVNELGTERPESGHPEQK